MRLFIATACVLLLTACAATVGQQPAQVSPEPQLQPSAEGAARPPVPEPRPKLARRTPAPAGGQAKAVPQATPEPATPRIDVPSIDVDALAGADRQSIRAILGPADEVRDQPPGEVWIYRENGCSIELYLFPQISAAQYAVLGHKILPSSLADEERTSCLTKLASRTQAS